MEINGEPFDLDAAMEKLREDYGKMDSALKEPAVAFLKDFTNNDKEKIKEAITEDPDSWVAPLHFYWGMGIRNALRTAGYDEKYFGINNLDDIYVYLIEDAVLK